jgi:hypothetical protein
VWRGGTEAREGKESGSNVEERNEKRGLFEPRKETSRRAWRANRNVGKNTRRVGGTNRRVWRIWKSEEGLIEGVDQ